MDSPADRQRFTKRLEAFSDIVFGFALAQTAFALEVPSDLHHLGPHLRDLIYFVATFALIAMLWIMHYRIFHYVFAARRTDVVYNFMLLGTVALLPYALRIFTRYPELAFGWAAYALALGLAFALIAALEYRGLTYLSGEMRSTWNKIALRHLIPAVVFLGSVPLFVVWGISARYTWALTGVGFLLMRRLGGRPPATGSSAAGTAASSGES